MEDISKRYPLMAAKVLMAIDYESLYKCKEASREMNRYLQNERVLWKQMISMNLSGNHF